MEERVQLPRVEVKRVSSLAYERLRLYKGIRDEYYHNESPEGGIVSGILLPESTRKRRYFYSVRTERTHCAYAMSSFSGGKLPPSQLGLGLKQGWELPSTPDPS